MAEKALALVVRGTDWSETSRIVTLWTREFGRVRGLAKGGRRLKSNFEIAFDLLTVCDIVFLRKAHGGLDLLTEARVVERFPHLRSDVKALYLGYYVAELLADGTQDYDPHSPLFDAAVRHLRCDAAEGDRHARLAAFELVWLRELGYSPRLDGCAVCGTPVPDPPPAHLRAAFSPAAGGIVCPACHAAAHDRRPLSAAALGELRRLVATAEGGATPPPLPAGVRAELRNTLAQAVSYVLGRRPKMLAYLETMNGER